MRNNTALYLGAFLAVAFLPCAGCTVAANGAGGKGGQSSSNPQDHVAQSTPIIYAWKDLPGGVPICNLDDRAATEGWLDRALIQHIGFQTGRWRIGIEPGYTVFRIYPFLAEGDSQPRVYQGIVLKVNGSLSVEQLLDAIRLRKTTVVLDEYALFGDGISIQKHSRPSRRWRDMRQPTPR